MGAAVSTINLRFQQNVNQHCQHIVISAHMISLHKTPTQDALTLRGTAAMTNIFSYLVPHEY